MASQEKAVKAWMRAHVSDYEDPRTGEVGLTELAQDAAQAADHDEWLDDELHPVWDWAMEVAEKHEGGRAMKPNARRITQKDLSKYIELINRRMDKDTSPYSRDGLQLDVAYGGYRIVGNDGSRDLSARGTAREVYQWLDGFAAALEFLA